MMQEKAREIFVNMVRECGEDIVRMQASFDMYLNQYLVDYPDEKHLLRDAYKVGIANKLLQHAGEADYEKYLQKLPPRFAEAAKRDENECAWGIETWAMALGRTADYVAPPKQDIVYSQVDEMTEPQKQMAAKTMMTIIVSSGGALGAGLAAIVIPLALWGMNFSASIYAADGEGGTSVVSEKTRWIYFGTTFFIAAAVGGFGALGGWLFGRGSEYPWAGFSVAFGAGMTMFFIVSVIYIPIIPGFVWKPVVLLASVFGAVYKTAARGGYY